MADLPSYSQHLPGPRQTGQHGPIDNATCLSIVQSTLQLARERARASVAISQVELTGSQQLQRPGVTIDLSHRGIVNIPIEVIELIKDEIERLALAHNQLTSFAEEFAGLPRLRYLNLRSNFLREFPLALTRLPSLEILDVSRNRLRVLPKDFGTLINLKVLSMSKNKINALPTYIADMNDLKILKLDHNPITFPPKAVWEVEDSDGEMWLDGVKRFLRQHFEKLGNMQDTESGSSGDEECGGDDFETPNPSISRTPSLESEIIDGTVTVRDQVPTIRPLRLSGTSDLQPRIVSCSGNWDGSSKLFRRPNNNPPAALSNVGVFGKPQAAQPSASTHHVSQTSVTERHRSNSESTVQGNRNKRLGMPPPPRTAANSTFLLENFTLIEPYKHHRGYSHDSVIDMNSPTTRSPNDSERRPGQYFRRLSSLPEHKRTSLSSARVGEAARGILYALSTLQKPIEQCVHSTKNTQGPHKKAERALYNGNFHIGSLVSALTSYEERDDELAVQKVIDACFSCVATFGQIMAMLQPSVKEVGFVSTSPDGRYIRTLILMIFGAYIEIRNSYSILRPSLVTNSTTENGNVVDTGVSTSAMDSSRHGQHPASSISALDANVSAAVTIPAFLATLRSTGSSFPGQVSPGTLQSISASHSDSGLDQEGALYQKFLIATSAALSNLPQVDREIKASGPQGLQPHITLKLREVTTLCISGTEVARRLSKLRWEAVQDGDISERKKFWDETIKFTNLIIGVAELIKSVSQEYAFSKNVLNGVGTVLRPTKDLYILVNGSALRHVADIQPSQGILSPQGFGFQTPAQQLMPATPLSAALGPAAQATLPQGGPYLGGSSPLGGYSGLSSRSATLVNSQYHTMTSIVSELGMSLGSGTGGAVVSSTQVGPLGVVTRERIPVKLN